MIQFCSFRLMKEVTAAREALATLKPHIGIGATAQPTAQAQETSESTASLIESSNASLRFSA